MKTTIKLSALALFLSLSAPACMTDYCGDDEFADMCLDDEDIASVESAVVVGQTRFVWFDNNSNHTATLRYRLDGATHNVSIPGKSNLLIEEDAAIDLRRVNVKGQNHPLSLDPPVYQLPGQTMYCKFTMVTVKLAGNNVREEVGTSNYCLETPLS